MGLGVLATGHARPVPGSPKERNRRVKAAGQVGLFRRRRALAVAFTRPFLRFGSFLAAMMNPLGVRPPRLSGVDGETGIDRPWGRRLNERRRARAPGGNRTVQVGEDEMSGSAISTISHQESRGIEPSRQGTNMSGIRKINFVANRRMFDALHGGIPSAGGQRHPRPFVPFAEAFARSHCSPRSSADRPILPSQANDGDPNQQGGVRDGWVRTPAQGEGCDGGCQTNR
jgi:hypothetical protein